MPNIVGYFRTGIYTDPAACSGCVTSSTENTGYTNGPWDVGAGVRRQIDASLVSPIYGSSSTVTPLSMTTAFLIRY